MTHYHIRWSGKPLDWEPFRTLVDAETSAKELVRPSETYTIEEHNGACPRCQNAMKVQSAESFKAKLVAVQKEMAKPRMATSARGARTNRATSQRKAKRP